MQANLIKLRRAMSSGVYTKLVNIFCSILIVPMVIGYLGSEQYGILIAVNALAHWILFDTGISEGLKQKLLMEQDTKLHGSLVSATIFAMLILAIFLLAISLLTIWLINFENTIEQSALVVATVTCVTLIPLKIARDIFTAYQDGAIYNISQAIGSVISLCFFWLAVKFQLPLWAFSACYTLPFIITGLVSLTKIMPKRYVWLSQSFSTPNFNFLLQDKALLAGFGMFGISRMLLNSADVVLINSFIGGDSAATYALVVRYFLYLEVAFGLISYPMWSFLTAARTSGDIDEYSTRWRQLKMAGLIFATFLAGLFFILSKPALQLWSAGQISPSGELLALACAYSSLRVVNDLSVSKLRVLGKSMTLGRTSFINLLLHLSIGSIVLHQTASIELFLSTILLIFVLTRVVPNMVVASAKF